MALFVNTNIASLNAQRNLSGSNSLLQTSLQRLSTGLRVNSAKDDAAGLAISQVLTSNIRGNQQATRNANDAISYAQVGEGALGQIGDNLQRIRELAVQAANGSQTDKTRSLLQNETDQLTAEVQRIIGTTEFNGTLLLTQASAGTAAANGALTADLSGSGVAFQVGYSGDVYSQVKLKLTSDLSALQVFQDFTGVGVSGLATSGTGINLTTSADASAALAKLDGDIETIAKSRAVFGAAQNRFEAVISNLQNYTENLTASRSRIIDADFAYETSQLSRNQILQQAGTAILSQANTLPQAALSLLR